jgi:hypothetical protein
MYRKKPVKFKKKVATFLNGQEYTTSPARTAYSSQGRKARNLKSI